MRKKKYIYPKDVLKEGLTACFEHDRLGSHEGMERDLRAGGHRRTDERERERAREKVGDRQCHRPKHTHAQTHTQRHAKVTAVPAPRHTDKLEAKCSISHPN